jgi:putative FmdB family regulatory protein
MPTYVYECSKCGDEFEHWQSFSEDPLKRHRGGCGGKLTKVIQPAGIVLKGSGFYKNDSRSNSKAAKREKTEKSESSSSSSSDKKSEPSSNGSSGSDSKSSGSGSGSDKSGSGTSSGTKASSGAS